MGLGLGSNMTVITMSVKACYGIRFRVNGSGWWLGLGW
jgi:hypothetical protein